MSESDTSAVLQLQDGQLLRCADTRDVWLTVVRGRVWVTRADDPDDHFLTAGQAMRLAPGAKAIVGAEGMAQLMVMQGPSRLQRVLGITMGLLFRPAAPVP